MQRAIYMEGRRLTGPEIDEICTSEKTLINYFSTLSAAQCEAYGRMLDLPEIDLPKNVKNGMKKLFTFLRDGRLKFEEHWAQNIGQGIREIQVTDALFTQIQQLQKIQKELS